VTALSDQEIRQAAEALDEDDGPVEGRVLYLSPEPYEALKQTKSGAKLSRKIKPTPRR
jgi:hypothetical protein